MKNWNGILTIIEIQHLDSDGTILWQQKNIKNMMHQEGEEFLLKAVFGAGNNPNSLIPDYYYLGLDNRSTIEITDTIGGLGGLIGEPISGGYERQKVESSGSFSFSQDGDHWLATSPIVAFRATTGTWGPIKNLFLTTENDNNGYLISTAVLNTSVLLTIGQSVTMRIGMKLAGC